MLTLDEAARVASRLWLAHRNEIAKTHDVTKRYLDGTAGVPPLISDAPDDIKQLAVLSVRNVMPLVVDSFTQSLSVVGFRSPSDDADDPVWEIWQRERMDARQQQAHRPAIGYGVSYIIEELIDGETKFHIRSPRQVYAEYDDPTESLWPDFALETWEETISGQVVTRGVLYDSTHRYELRIAGKHAPVVRGVAEPVAHGFPNAPVVRFINEIDAEDRMRGEVQPLKREQKALNMVNFDRLCVSRFGAFPQKYVFGWAPETSEELAAAGVRRIMAFDDVEGKAGTFAAASTHDYNELMSEMIGHIAMKARVPAFALTGDISNVGSETIALIDAPNQRKVASKQESFGESWEQALRLAAAAEGVEVSTDAEVKWRETEARSFAQIVDGIVKLQSAGVPIRSLVDQIPGLTQTQSDAIVAEIDRADAQSLTAQILAARQSPAEVATA